LSHHNELCRRLS